MINVVMSAFFVKNEPDDFYSTIKTWTILGLHWTQYIKNFKLCNEGKFCLSKRNKVKVII